MIVTKPNQSKNLPFHSTTVAETEQALQSNATTGLSASTVSERRTQGGSNTLQIIRNSPWWQILLQQFVSLIVALLAIASLIAWSTADYVEAIAILVVLLFNGVVGFATEWQAGRALEALRKQTHVTVRVRRDGIETIIEAADLVPGDVVILNAGDAVPADLRLIDSADLRLEESALTGESAAVEKSSAPVMPAAPLAERSSMLYLGTSVVAGHGQAFVTAIGSATELGKIGQLVANAPNETTPLKRRLDELGRRLVYLVLVIGAAVVGTGWLRGYDIWLIAEVGISLAVAAIPEALPAVTTLILALGVLRMAKQNAIVRRLASVETLGSTTIICTDKTGTLTENRMTVREYFLANGEVIKPDESIPAQDELLIRALRVCILCNEASFALPTQAEAQAVGDPTETALLLAAHKLGVKIEQLRVEYPKLAEIPFAADTRRMLTLHQSPEKKYLIALKGAPSAVLPFCSHYAAGDKNVPLDNSTRQLFSGINEEMADRALRVLALAEKTLAAQDEKTFTTSEPDHNYTLLGFVGMSDPPRQAVPAAIQQARAAGIRVVMLTGDQINTARAIAEELKLSGEAKPIVLHARDLVGADEARIAELARTTDVFARVSPEDKLQIVAALQNAREIVAVTGDGVNDAPALKRANIGIAMGARGTEVAKEAADVVLADDNFATIIKAIEGGRTIYANIIKFVHLMFSKNLAAVLVIFTTVVAGWPLPLLPLQILWLNMLMDVFPALALAVEPGGADVMQRPPRSPQEPLLSRPLLILIFWQALMLTVIILVAYSWSLQRYGAGVHARTIALLALVGSQLGHTFNCRSRTRSAFTEPFSNPFVWAATVIVIGLQFLALYWPFLAQTLALTPPNSMDWAVIALTVVVPVIIVEITKLVQRKGK